MKQPMPWQPGGINWKSYWRIHINSKDGNKTWTNGSVEWKIDFRNWRLSLAPPIWLTLNTASKRYFRWQCCFNEFFFSDVNFIWLNHRNRSFTTRSSNTNVKWSNWLNYLTSWYPATRTMIPAGQCVPTRTSLSAIQFSIRGISLFAIYWKTTSYFFKMNNNNNQTLENSFNFNFCVLAEWTQEEGP